MTKFSALLFPQMNLIASERGSYLVSWSGLTAPTSLILGQQNSGQFILSFQVFQSTFTVGQIRVLAYIPSLPDSFQDFAASFCRKWETQNKDIIMHCRRKLIHSIWKFLLDDDFVHALWV